MPKQQQKLTSIDKSFNFVCVGGQKVGITIFVTRTILSPFYENYTYVIHQSFRKRYFKHGHHEFDIKIWDVLNANHDFQYRYQIQFADVLFICVDLSKSFDIQVQTILKFTDLKNKYCPTAKVLVLGMKHDIQVIQLEMMDYCDSQKLQFIPVSSKTNLNVDLALKKGLMSIQAVQNFALKKIDQTVFLTKKPKKIQFCGDLSSLEVAKTMFFEVNQQLLQLAGEFCAEFDLGNQVQVFDNKCELKNSEINSPVILIFGRRRVVNFSGVVLFLQNPDEISSILARILDII
uniref:Rab-like protein n=1 Tax=Trepomonas sp. PC1 TaxID=1076344 RepID=A0A146K893_9EUKA|eukprot:JAP92588.1 Rab-like protein [Trepomonas sp. PC1]